MTSPFRTPEDIRKDKSRFVELQENFVKLQENLAKLEILDNNKRSQALLHRVRNYKSQPHTDLFELDSDNS
jgi:hypothetical protein